MTLFRTQFVLEGLGVFRALDKLKRGGVSLFHVEELAKNRMTFEVASKEREKVFAILRGSCYNIREVRRRGLSLFCRKCVNAAGLIVGAALFCGAVLGAQTRVLKIEVVGNGAYYEREIGEVLSRGGVKFFSAVPADTAALTAEILAFPRVSFCTISHAGGVLTVDVRVSDESAIRESVPLTSPVSGTVAELIVVRGTALVKEGDEVESGQTVVDCFALYGGETRPVVVMASVTVEYRVSEEFSGGEEEALAAAFLKYGEIEGIETKKTERGWLVSGTARAVRSLNLG